MFGSSGLLEDRAAGQHSACKQAGVGMHRLDRAESISRQILSSSSSGCTPGTVYVPVFACPTPGQPLDQVTHASSATSQATVASSSAGCGTSTSKQQSGNTASASCSSSKQGAAKAAYAHQQHQLSTGLEHITVFDDFLLLEDSLQLALEGSSSKGWQLETLDSCVAIIGAAPAWLQDIQRSTTDSSTACCSGRDSNAVFRPIEQLLPQPAPKTCVTVSYVSSELDSLAILPLHDPAPVQNDTGAVAGSQLHPSRYLGQF